MVRAFVSLPLLAIPGPCTTFDGESPSAPIVDAGESDATDASTPDVVPLGPQPYLFLEDAVRACSLIARCPTLALSVGLSIAVPVASGTASLSADDEPSPVPLRIALTTISASNGSTRVFPSASIIRPVGKIVSPLAATKGGGTGSD